MRQNTKVILIALCVMLTSVVGSGVLNVAIASSQGRHDLTYTDRAEDGAPLEVSLGVAMGAFRGIFVNVLWLRATNAKEEGRFYESIELARSITRLQPRLPRVWTFHAWNLSYNISVTTHTPEERWTWVKAGIDLLRKEGLRTNPTNMHIHKELAWMILHKVGGYTDDANQHYKREWAFEWHNILGQPPEVPITGAPRDEIIEAYAQWLQKIVDAPGSIGELRAVNPTAASIADAFEDRIGEPIGTDFLRRYQLDLELSRAGRDWMFEQGALGRKTTTMREMRETMGSDEDWDLLVSTVRRMVLEDEYNMEPVRMVHVTRKFGPIDWRLAPGHALYWAARGTDLGRMQVTPRNSDSFDFLNAFRMVMQSVQELWRHGDVYFNYIDMHEGRTAYYQAVPNEHFVPSYGAMMREVVENSGIYEGASNPYRQYSSGYENFLRDAVRFFYRRGEIARAEYWFNELRTFSGQNMNDPDRVMEMSLSLREFADKQLYDNLGSPQKAVSEVSAALVSAYLNGLLSNDTEAFNGYFDYAKKVHAYFFSEQFMEVVASTSTARMEYMDRDFRVVAGQLFANVVTDLPPSDGELLYGYAPPDLQRYAYDALVTRYKSTIDALAEQDRSEPFAVLFPEPPGMDAFRAEQEARRQQRSGRGIEGARKN